MARALLSVASVVALALLGCESSQKKSASPHAPPAVAAKPAAPPLAPPAVDAETPAEYPGLHNVVTYAAGLYSGSVPEGTKGFDSLARLGIQTVISVDGAQPDVEEARRLGMRYVHLPIGYNGMDRQRTLEIARAIRDLPGPVYLHCHHGRHRSAGALGAAIVTLGLIDNAAARQRMQVSGTSPSYTGLYRCVAVATVASAAELNQASSEFPEHWKTSGLVKSMVEIDEVYELLKLIEKAGWRTPADHPDLVPAAEAGRLADLYRNLKDDEQTLAKPPELMEWMIRSADEAAFLESGLVDGAADPAELSKRFAAVTKSCKDCHVKYRD